MKKPPAFTAAQATRLTQFLSAPERPEGTMTYCELAGFLFAVACSPEMVQMSEWIPVIFNEKEGSFESLEEAQEILPLIMGLYNHVNSGIAEDESALPPCEIGAPAIMNLEPDAPLSQWAHGFVVGHDWLKNVWDEYTPAEYDETLGEDLLIISFFASHDLAEAYRVEFHKKDVTLETLADVVVVELPRAMRSYARIGRILSKAVLREPTLVKATPVRSMKIGRNDPCPCGSGKKYKHCCGAARH
jgi:uncharacterized protein